MKSLYCLSLAFLLGFSGFSQQSGLKNGDIIFIKNKDIKGKSLLPTGKSKFNYVGIVFFDKDVPMVYHAMEPLTKCSVDNFLLLCEGKDVVVKHLAEEELLTEEVIKTMRGFAEG